MFRQSLFTVMAGMLAVVIARTVYATPFSDVVAPQAADAAGRDLPPHDH